MQLVCIFSLVFQAQGWREIYIYIYTDSKDLHTVLNVDKLAPELQQIAQVYHLLSQG